MRIRLPQKNFDHEGTPLQLTIGWRLRGLRPLRRTRRQGLCRGIAALEAGRAKDAVMLLDSAASKLLFEYPNFQVLPRLALAHWRSGDAENAREVLELSRATLSVLTGIYRCSQGPGGFTLQTRGDSIRSGIREATMRRVCGAAYEWVYEPSTLEAAAADAEIIRLYLNAVEEIDGGS